MKGVRGEIVIGEATPGYMWSKTAARNIYDRIHVAKILVVLCDPADRAFSQYLQFRAVIASQLTFREHIEANLRNRREHFGIDYPLLEFGLYYDQLLRYFKPFLREQICIQLYDDYVADPAGTFSAIFRFLGVDPTFVPNASQRHLEARSPRRPRLALTLQKAGIWQAAKRFTPRALLPGARVRAARALHDEPRRPAISGRLLRRGY